MKRNLLLSLLALSLLSVVSACNFRDGGDVEVEGDEAGECSDGVDNDQDGPTDCDDPGCATATACTGGDDDDDDDATDDDDSAADDDDSTADDDDDSSACPDADFDGFEDAACGGLDCDDNLAGVNPAAPETCPNGVDENCDEVVDGMGCVDPEGWVLQRMEPLDSVPLDAVVQTNFAAGSMAGRDAVCVSDGSNHYMTLPHGSVAAAAERVAVQVDAYTTSQAKDVVLQAAIQGSGSSYFRLRLWQDANQTNLIEFNQNLGSNHVINSAGGQSSQQWHTLRLEFDRGNGDVVASIDGTEWYTGSAFLASLVGTDMSLYGWAGDNFTNAVCFTDWSIWTDGEVVAGG